MCNVNELKRAKQRIAELEAQLAVMPSPPPTPPVVRRDISGGVLHQLLQMQFEDADIYISDNIKYLCDIEDIDRFLLQDNTNRMTYVAEEFDCDDFAYRLMGQFSIPGWAKIAKGIYWDKGHAMLCCVDANLDVWIIEPQTDGASLLTEPRDARLIVM